MLHVSSEYLKAIVGDVREMPYRVTLGGSVVLDQNDIPNMTLEESVSGNSGLSIGTANAAELSITIRDPDLMNYDGLTVEPESGLVLPDGSIEWVPLGKFWVTKTSTSDDYRTVKLTCSDGMCKMSGQYVSNLRYPALLIEVVGEIAEQTGVVAKMNGSAFSRVRVYRRPEGLTHRAALGYAAGCAACNARFNRYGELEFAWYNESGITIEREAQYMNGMTRLHDKPLDVGFSITGKEVEYFVTVIPSGPLDNYTVDVTPDIIHEGDLVTVKITPESGYEVQASTCSAANATVDHVAGSTVYKYTQELEDVEITVGIVTSRFYNAYARANGNGTVKFLVGDGSTLEAQAGSAEYVDVLPLTGNKFDGFHTVPSGVEFEFIHVRSDGTSRYRFCMPESDLTITANFRPAENYNVSYTCASDDDDYVGGSVVITNGTRGGTAHFAGDDMFVRAYPITGYEVSECICSTDITLVGTDYYNFTMPEEDVTIVMRFRKKHYNISSVAQCYDSSRDSEPPGTVTVVNETTAGNEYHSGDVISLYITGSDGHVLDRVSGAGSATKVDEGHYRFTMPSYHLSITCYFIHPATGYSLRSPRGIETDVVTLEYTNPFISERDVPIISSLVQGITYSPARVKFRGNPALQAGDIVMVPDKNGNYHTVPIMQQTMTFGGGMNAEIRCPGETAEVASYSNFSPINTQIKQELSQQSSELARHVSNNAAAIDQMDKTMRLNDADIRESITDLNERVTAAEVTITSHTADIKYLRSDLTNLMRWVNEVAPPTELGDLKRQLAETDQQIAHCSEVFMLEVIVTGTEPAAVVLPYNISELHTTRETLRAQIAELEATINE